MTDIALADWVRLVKEIESPRILSCGEKVWQGSVNHDRKCHAPHGRWLASDLIPGDGVEFAANLETLEADMLDQHIPPFDAIFCPSVLEHVRRPWLAMEQMSKGLKIGGVLIVNTHQTFPLHNYPSDYYRFSTEALRALASDYNLRVISACYTARCTITPPRDYGVWNTAAESWLGVSMCAIRHV